MTTQALRHREAATLHRLAAVLLALARRMGAAAKRLDGWLEARRIAAAARAELGAMSERELHDIGLTRADIHSVAHGGSPLFHA